MDSNLLSTMRFGGSIIDTLKLHINAPILGTAMFTRILTDTERKKLQVFVDKGEVPETLRLLVSRIRKFKPKIEEDLTLMKLAERRYQERKFGKR